jgi:hypothetical protein
MFSGKCTTVFRSISVCLKEKKKKKKKEKKEKVVPRASSRRNGTAIEAAHRTPARVCSPRWQ